MDKFYSTVYIIDCEEAKAERNYLNYMTYVNYFYVQLI